MGCSTPHQAFRRRPARVSVSVSTVARNLNRSGDKPLCPTGNIHKNIHNKFFPHPRPATVAAALRGKKARAPGPDHCDEIRRRADVTTCAAAAQSHTATATNIRWATRRTGHDARAKNIWRLVEPRAAPGLEQIVASIKGFFCLPASPKARTKFSTRQSNALARRVKSILKSFFSRPDET